MILLRRSYHADCDVNVFVERQRRDKCEDFVADLLQTITAMGGSKWSVPEDCAAGYRQASCAVRTRTLEEEGVRR